MPIRVLMARRHIIAWLDKPDIRAQPGVHDSIGNFSSCSSAVGSLFNAHQDRLRGSTAYVAELLQRDIRVLIYVGMSFITPLFKLYFEKNKQKPLLTYYVFQPYAAVRPYEAQEKLGIT